MAVKANQPDLQWEVEHLFANADLVAATSTVHRTVDKGHGRLECRRLWASTALAGYSDWPALAQALCIEREVTILATGEVRRDRAYAVTSLPSTLADAAALLALWRGHGGIENRLHWVRDVLFDEDRSGATVGNVPQMLAALHNTVIGLLRAHDRPAIAAARRHLARAAADTLPLLGLAAQ
jgi:predicted transposase YbfD/YdcC